MLARSVFRPAPGSRKATVTSSSVRVSFELTTIPSPQRGWRTRSPSRNCRSPGTIGRGAGAGPTASAVVSDLIAAALSKRTPGRRAGDACTCLFEKQVLPVEETRSRYYLRLRCPDQIGGLARIAQVFGEEQVSIAQVIQGTGGPDYDDDSDEAELVMVTHTVRDANLQAVVRRLKQMPDTVRAVENVIRVEA